MSIKLKIKRYIRRFFAEKRYLRGRFLAFFGVIVFIFLGFGIYQFILLPKIDLKGSKKIVVDYKESYVEKGYKAKYLGSDVTDDVVVRGKVNSKKLGTYKIVYKLKNGLFSRKVTRTIVVEDREKPKMSVKKGKVYVCPGDEIVPEKIEAKDNYDGDLTKKIKHVISKDKSYITYSVVDSSGNEASIQKKIIYKDREKPVITLKEGETIYLFVGDEFNDPGIEVKDNCDSSLQDKVAIAGSVDTSTVGDYVITYQVKDAAGNEEKVTRTVKVSERSKNGTIYLTFDDGPNSGTTDVILDILKEEGVSATFFVTNKGPDELIKREYDEGHTVALHTASHDYSIVYASDESYFNDLYSVQDRVKRITGFESKIIRFPGGSSNTVSRKYSQGIMSRITKETLNRGFKYYDWNVSSGDAAGGNLTADIIYNNTVNSLRHDRANMVLMHDIKPYTRDALRNVIRYAKENGYHFEKITMATEMVTQGVNN